MAETEVGEVFQYYSKVGVAAVKITGGRLKVGDRIHFLGHTTDFTQTLESIQVEHDNVEQAEEGKSVGIKVLDRVRPADKVYLVEN